MRPDLRVLGLRWLKGSQITYDLNQVAPNEVFALRDTILAALQAYKTGPRSIIVQLSLALAGLAAAGSLGFRVLLPGGPGSVHRPQGGTGSRRRA